MATNKLLVKAAEIIDEPGKWCKHAFFDGDAYCMGGAIHKVNGSSPGGIGIGQPSIHDILKAPPSYTVGNDISLDLFNFNDAVDTTQADAVLFLLLLSQLTPEEMW